MRKILFILVTTIMISSCNASETTFIVKFKNGTEMKVVGIDTYANKDCFYIYHIILSGIKEKL